MCFSSLSRVYFLRRIVCGYNDHFRVHVTSDFDLQFIKIQDFNGYSNGNWAFGSSQIISCWLEYPSNHFVDPAFEQHFQSFPEATVEISLAHLDLLQPLSPHSHSRVVFSILGTLHCIASDVKPLLYLTNCVRKLGCDSFHCISCNDEIVRLTKIRSAALAKYCRFIVSDVGPRSFDRSFFLQYCSACLGFLQVSRWEFSPRSNNPLT